jgi:xanthine dehydrogenase accessory factor
MSREIFQTLTHITSGEVTGGVLVIVVKTDDHVPRNAGSKMFVRSDGSLIGSIGGGAVEKSALNHALGMINKGIPTKIQSFSLGKMSDNSEDTGMVCGGDMTVYFELIQGPDRLFVFGGGHIGSVLAPLASQCGFAVTVIDNRKEVASSSRFTSDVRVVHKMPQDYAKSLILQRQDSVVILTHDHMYDRDVLKQILQKKEPRPRYIGMIGSRRKIAATFNALEKEGVNRKWLDAVCAPIGLGIGADLPAELAVSILSEVMAFRADSFINGSVKSVSRGAVKK